MIRKISIHTPMRLSIAAWFSVSVSSSMEKKSRGRRLALFYNTRLINLSSTARLHSIRVTSLKEDFFYNLSSSKHTHVYEPPTTRFKLVCTYSMINLYYCVPENKKFGRTNFDDERRRKFWLKPKFVGFADTLILKRHYSIPAQVTTNRRT